METPACSRALGRALAWGASALGGHGCLLRPLPQLRLEAEEGSPGRDRPCR